MDYKVDIEVLDHANDFPLPTYATTGSAGFDLMAAVESDLTMKPGDILIVPTGIKIKLPEKFEAQVRPRSGNAAKYGITVLNTPGTIDSDYRGEIKVILINHGKEDFIVKRGIKIAQVVIAEYTVISWNKVESLENETTRGDKGFGSTGL